MKIPGKLNVATSEILNAQTKFLLLCAKYGCQVIDTLMDSLLLKEHDSHNKQAGRFLIGKVCEEFLITEYDLFESKARKELTDARKVYCAVAYEVFDLTQDQIGRGFGSDRNLVYRALKDITEAATSPNPAPYQKQLLQKYNRVLFRMRAYLNFKTKGGNDVENEIDAK